MAGLIACAISPHIPRIAIEEKAPEFQRDMIAGMRALGAEIRAMKPDALVMISAHWFCTFNWYVNTHARHAGICVADEAPDLVPGLPYDYPGDPALGERLTAVASAAGLPCFNNANPEWSWDYACYVTSKYLDPDGEIPQIQIPCVAAADFAECERMGQLVDQAARESGKRVVFVAATALAHDVVRGPERWPSEDQMAADAAFVDALKAGHIDALWNDYPAYARRVVAEMGGRPLATFLGATRALQARQGKLSGESYGPYTQSSGSGNLSVLVR